jgi:hypothetical protein
LIATVEDLTDMLDYASEDINGMDDDAGAEPAQNPPITGRWTATSTYDVYMVDTPKEDDDGNQDLIEDKPIEVPPKRRRQRRRSRSRRGKESNTGTGDNDTPENAEDSEHPIEPAVEQDDGEDGQVNLDELTENDDSEDSKYLPASEEEVSLSNEDFIVPEEPLEQERFRRQLIATVRSLKKKQQRLQAEEDTLNDRWTKVLVAEEYGLERPTKSYPKHRLLPQFDNEAPEPILPRYNPADEPDRPPRGRDRMATHAEYQPAPPRRTSRGVAAPDYTYDLR